MRFANFLPALLLTLTACAAWAESMPSSVKLALERFRTEGPSGWSYTQRTRTEKRSQLEQFNPAAPQAARWLLLEQNDQPPSPSELEDYQRLKQQRSSAFSAPKIESLLDPSSCRVLEESSGLLRVRLDFKRGKGDDESFQYLHAEYLVDSERSEVRSLTLANDAPFSPVFGVRIREARSTFEYGPCDAKRPGFLLRATIHLRGRAFLLKSLDDDMTVEWFDYKPAGPGAQGT